MSSLADLVRSRRESGGSIAGSLSYGFKERMKESFDPRRMINQGGLLTALFPSLKSYKAGSGKRSIGSKSILGENSQLSSDPILESIRLNTRTSAKNSLVLPSMARDVFVMNKNIKQMVKIFGGKPKDTADEWFSRQAAREAAYESRFGLKTKSKKDTKPTPEKEPDKKGFFRTIADMVMRIPFIASLAGVISKLSGAIAKIAGPVGSVIAVVALLGGVFFRLIKFLSKFTMFSALIGTLGLGVLMDKWNNFQKMSGDLNKSIGDTQSISKGLGADGTSPDGAPGGVQEKTYAEAAGSGLSAYVSVKGAQAVSRWAHNRGVASKAAKGFTPKIGSEAKLGKQNYRFMGKQWAEVTASGKTGRMAEKGITKELARIASQTKGEKMLMRISKSLSKIIKNGKVVEFITKLLGKFGKKIAMIAVKFLVGVLGVPLAATGLGALFSITMWGLAAYELYDLYQCLYGPGGILTEMEGESDTSPTQESTGPASALPGATGSQGTRSTSIGGVKGASDKRQAVAVKEMQSDKEIFKTDDYLAWREGQWKEKGFSSMRKNLSSGMYDPLFGVDAYKKAKNLTGTQKTAGDKIKNGNAEVRKARTEAQRPQVNVMNKEKTTPKKPTQSGGTDITQASVYDEEFLKLLGMSTTNLGKTA